MKAPTQLSEKRNTLSRIGLILSAIPILVWLLWAVISSAFQDLTQVEKREKFFSFFPGLLHDGNSLSVFVLTFAVASVVLCAIGHRKADETFRVLGIAAIVVSSLIILLQLFTMM